MIFRNKSPKAGVSRIMTVISHHPVIIHLESILIGFLAVNINLSIFHRQFITLVNMNRTLINRKILYREFQKVLNLNLTGTVLPTQIFLKPMVEQKKGAIVNFSSMAAFRPMTRVCGYAAAKAGISNFTAFMANEVATKFGEGIRVNAIAPGFFLTEQNRTLLTNYS
jgi:NAD(P)-dependent dehydrogenase (short-subunit alcohol dehydrogenase family)